MSKAPTLQPGQFYGIVDQRWRTGLVTISLLNHAVVRQVPSHSHEHIFLSLLLQGGYREEPLTEILDDLLGAEPSSAARPRWLKAVEEYLQGCYREPVSLRALADTAGVHPIHVARVFRRHHGCTIRSFLQRCRVMHACERIAQGREGLASVAVDSGFYDQSHMTHVFRHVTGLTPTAYRKLSAYGARTEAGRKWDAMGRKPRERWPR
jgi:AraC-like DNA-binding protein